MNGTRWANKQNKAIYLLQKLPHCDLWVLVHPQTKSQWAPAASTPKGAFAGHDLKFEKM